MTKESMSLESYTGDVKNRVADILSAAIALNRQNAPTSADETILAAFVSGSPEDRMAVPKARVYLNQATGNVDLVTSTYTILSLLFDMLPSMSGERDMMVIKRMIEQAMESVRRNVSSTVSTTRHDSIS